MARGFAPGRVRTTTATEPRNMAAMLQIIIDRDMLPFLCASTCFFFFFVCSFVCFCFFSLLFANENFICQLFGCHVVFKKRISKSFVVESIIV